MSLKDEVNNALAAIPFVGKVRVNKDADNHGRKGTSVIVELTEEKVELEMYFADNNKLDNVTVAELVKHKVSSYLNNTAEIEETP